MRELVTRMPDVDAFLGLAPEELAAKMLFLMGERNQADFHRDSLENELWGAIGTSEHAAERLPGSALRFKLKAGRSSQPRRYQF